MTPPPDRFECQPADWSSTPEQDFDDFDDFDFEPLPQEKAFKCTGMEGQPVQPGIAVMAQVSPTLKEKVKRAAGDGGVSVSEWLRRLIVKELE